MNTCEINKYLNNFIHFFGTYPKDLLPKALAKKAGIVINTDNSNQPGEHWVAVFLRPNGYAEYFDSFGMPPMHMEIIEFLDNISPLGWFYNTIGFQSIYQNTCGMYCVYYLANYFNGGDFDLFRSIFNHSSSLNDRLAKILYKHREFLK